MRVVMSISTLLGVVLLNACAMTTAAAEQSSSPDLILAHGKVLTIDAADSVGQALAIKDGKVLKVGSDAAILALGSPRTKIIDLHGHTATPGLIDTHAHIAEGGLGEVIALQLGDATSVAEINDAIKGAASGALKGILDVVHDKLVSVDFNHHPASSSFALDQTKVMDGNFVSVMSWYDNEWGFSNRMADTAVAMGKLL